MKKFKALDESKELFEFCYNDNPICPHCGNKFDIRENEAWNLYDDNDRHEIECLCCYGRFHVESHNTWTFSTDEQERRGR